MIETILVLIIVLFAGVYVVLAAARSVKNGECPSCKDCPCGEHCHKRKDSEKNL